MKNQFRILLLMLITSTIVYAQKASEIEMDEKHTIYKENFTTNHNTTLVLNLNNTSAQVMESPDDKVYVEYTKEFKNTRKKRIQDQLKLLIVSGKKEDNKITYSSKGRNDIHDRLYSFEELMINRSEKNKFLKDSLRKPVERKSLDSVLHEIKASDSIYRNKLLGALKIKPRVKKWKKSDQIIITKMVVKIPRNIHVRATLENSNLVFMDDFYNRATMNVRNSKLRFKSIGNSLNIFDFDNGYFNAEVVSGGSYSFANAKEVRIGRLRNSLLTTEFTKIEIGKIGSKNKIIDFNSKFIFHNFSKDFKVLEMNTEYSEISMFFNKSMDYELKTLGNNTRHYIENKLFDYKLYKKNMKPIMLDVLNKTSETLNNIITINTTNGIIRISEDVIKF